jgi:hypothetical protein
MPGSKLRRIARPNSEREHLTRAGAHSASLIGSRSVGTVRPGWGRLAPGCCHRSGSGGSGGAAGDPSRGRGYALPGLPEAPTYVVHRTPESIVVDGRGRVWAAGERGIACFEDDAWHGLTGLQGLPLRGFERLWAGSDGDMWIASRAGLYRFSTRAEPVWLAADGYQPGHVRDLLVDGRGAAWVVGDSLVYRVGADGRRVLGKQDGLPSSRLTALAMDKAGNVWIAGIPTGRSYFDGGVGRFDGESWELWRQADGLLTNQVSALFADREGRIWVGYPNGAVSLFDGQAWDHWSAGPYTGPASPPPPVARSGWVRIGFSTTTRIASGSSAARA